MPPSATTMPAGRYAGQVAIVTGAAHGIGRATARRLAAEGAAVVLADRAAEPLAAAAAIVRADGGSAEHERLDVRDEGEFERLVAAVAERHGRLDVLVNTVGAAALAPVAETTSALLREAVAVNLESALTGSRAALAQMRPRRYGRIVNVASGTVMLGLPEHGAYVAAKAGVIGLTRVLAREAGADGITANVVMPGLIETEGTTQLPATFFDRHIDEQCVKRRGLPEDVAACIAYLAAPEAGFVTGQTISVGGGHTFR